MKINGALEVPDEAIAAFCRKWRITELALFGSVLREDFGPESDVDVLVTVEKGASIDLFDLGEMRDEMARIVGRPVDLFERGSVEKGRNPFRRRSILSTAQVVYRVA